MATNLMQTASLLKNMPDSTLAQLAHGNQHPEVPQYLVMAEINRRQSLRSGATAAGNNADQSTVMDDLMAKQSSGQMAGPGPYGPQPVPGFAGGGMVDGSYTDQGIPLYNTDVDAYSVPDPSKWVVPLPSYLQFGIDDMIGNDQRSRKAAADKQQKKLADRRAASSPSVAPPPLPPGSPMAKPSVPKIDPFEYDGAAPPPIPGAAAKASGSKFNIDDYAPPPIPKQSAPGQGTSTMTANPFSSDDAPMSDDAIASKYKLPDRVDKPKTQSAADFMDAINKANPGDVYDRMTADFDEKKKKNADNRQQALGMALMQAGFGMAASKSPSFLSALGEGGLRGATTLQQEANDIQKYDRELDRDKNAMELAKAAHNAGNYKMAADEANHANTNAYHMYDVDRKERGDEIRSIRQTMSEDRKDARAAQNLRYQYDRLESMERMKVDQMNRADRNAYLRMKAQMAHYDKLADKPTAEQRTTQWLMAADIDDPARREMEAASRQGAYQTMQGLKSQNRDIASVRRDYDKIPEWQKRQNGWGTFEQYLNAQHPDMYGGRGAQPAGAGGFKILNVQ